MRTTLALATAACLTLPVIGAGAEAPAVVTLVEDQAALLRSSGRFALAEGVRLQAGDVVEVGDKGLVQIGLADGTKLSLGPQSRFHVAALAASRSDFYLLQGWSKFALARPATPLRVTTPFFGLGAAEAIVVLHVRSEEASLFVEKGELRLSEGFVKASATSAVAVRAGQFYARKAEQRGTLLPRPAPAFVAAMPRHYQDNLPERLAKHKDREVAPRRLGDLAYADVEAWLKGPPDLRRPMMQRLRSHAREPQFRKALIANLSFHPEWDRILFPDKYKPKPPPVAGPAAAPQAKE
jgi:hypothetical protein